MSQRTPSKSVPRGRSLGNRKTKRNCIEADLSFLHHSSMKAASPRVPCGRYLGSTIRNSNPEKSTSMKGKQCYQSRATSRRRVKKLRQPCHNVSKFELADDSIHVESITAGQKDLEDSLLRTSKLRDLAGQTDRERLTRDLLVNSLELFRMGEKVCEFPI